MWVDNIKLYFGEIGRGGMDWSGLVRDRDQWRALVNAIICLRISHNTGKFLCGCTTGGL
jgi:hypothetical protein